MYKKTLLALILGISALGAARDHVRHRTETHDRASLLMGIPYVKMGEDNICVYAHQIVFDGNSLVPMRKRIRVKELRDSSEEGKTMIQVSLDSDFGDLIVDPTESRPFRSRTNRIEGRAHECNCMLYSTDVVDLTDTLEDVPAKAIHLELIQINGADRENPLEALRNIYLMALVRNKGLSCFNSLIYTFGSATSRVKPLGREAARFNQSFDYETIDRSYNRIFCIKDRSYEIGGKDFDTLLLQYATDEDAKGNNAGKKVKEYLKQLLSTGIRIFLPVEKFPNIALDPEFAERITWE